MYRAKNVNVNTLETLKKHFRNTLETEKNIVRGIHSRPRNIKHV